MLSLNDFSFKILARANYGGYRHRVTEFPTEDELPLLKSGIIEAVPICTDGRCAYIDRAAGHVCTYAKLHSRDCRLAQYYMEIPGKVSYRISITDKGRAFFYEKMSRQERIYLLLEMMEWRWALYEVNRLAAEELPAFLSHKRKDIRRGAWVRLYTLDKWTL